MSATSFARWLSSSTRRVRYGRHPKVSGGRVRLFLEHLEGRDLPAPLTILPTMLETSVGRRDCIPLRRRGRETW